MQLSLKKSYDKWLKVGDAEFKLDYPTREQYQELQSIAFSDKFSGNDKMLKYAQLFIKYAVKDWKGIIGADGEPLHCELKGNQLDEELWWALVQKPLMALNIYNEISPEIEFTDIDKKK